MTGQKPKVQLLLILVQQLQPTVTIFWRKKQISSWDTWYHQQ